MKRVKIIINANQDVMKLMMKTIYYNIEIKVNVL